ncbi:polycomb group RING finger protein 6-like [Clavelina lepadiformis]|uniref:Polycomb group RING finger protein 1 n=1 Tax=Clavelina lepadiformis TaxID=159417 RepID=A0ABP0GZF1_CLALP
MSDITSPFKEFMDQYAIQHGDSESRYFTKSQIYTAFRTFLSRTRPNERVCMDYQIFCIEFNEEVEKRGVNKETSEKVTYYKLFKNSFQADINQQRETEVNDTLNISARALNIHLCCKLCCGYLVDATTITECLHSFCKSCIVQYFQTENSCPVCQVLVHNTNPLASLKQDNVLQDIVNKVLPGVSKHEAERFSSFQEVAVKKSKVSPECAHSSKPRNPFVFTSLYIEWVGPESCTVEAEDLKGKHYRVCDRALIGHVCQLVVEQLGYVDSTNKPTMNCVLTCGGIVLPPIIPLAAVVKHELNFEMKDGAIYLKYDIQPFK